MRQLDFKKQNGLIPCIVQDVETKKVLMLAYMNEESYKKTVETKLATHYQHVKKIRIDCDEDTILLEVEQVGAACHTGHYSCFYRDENGECIDE